MSMVKVADAAFPTEFGNFRIFGFESNDKSDSAVALVMGKPAEAESPLVRIHSQCLTGDVFGSSRCDCGAQLNVAQKAIAESGAGILIYHLQGEKAIRDLLEQWFEERRRLFISAITRIELLAAPILREDEEALIQNFLNQFILLPVDAQTADVAARIRRIYRLKLGDSIIAASAILTNSILATRNVRDFKKITELGLLAL